MINDIREQAREILTAEGFAVDLGPGGEGEVRAAVNAGAAKTGSGGVKDLRDLPWSSIDNMTTRDVDQIEMAEPAGGGTRVRIAIADVDALVPKGSVVDARAAQNTVSVYAGDVLLPMLPKELSEGATSLLSGQDRLAIVADFVVTASGDIADSSVYRAIVRNRIQLDYGSIGDWLSGKQSIPDVARGFEEQLRMQHDAAVRLHRERNRRGALEFARRETHPVLRDGVVVDIEMTELGPARDLIEDFMIAANSVIAGFLENHNVSWIRRMVGAPERWPKIVELAARSGVRLPEAPDRRALGEFLCDQRMRDPSHFSEVSVSVLRLLGSGSYVVEHRMEDLEAHFALGVEDYTHFTAPNRRYADIVTQRILKSVLAGVAVPYSDAELDEIAAHCTKMEDRAKSVERKVARLAAVELMSKRVGSQFNATIAAAHGRGVVALIASPAVEVRVGDGEGYAVGDHVKVRIDNVDDGVILGSVIAPHSA